MPSFGNPWYHLPICNSTNDEAQRLGRAGAAEGTVVTADAQRAGRGRLGRHWHSPADENLYLSVLLRPPFLPQRAPLLSLCAGLALHQATSAIFAERACENPRAPEKPRLLLKWPNDLLGACAQTPYRKLGGILTELVCAGAAIDFIVVGVGCNVNGSAFPAELAATSLQLLNTPAGPPSPAATPPAKFNARQLAEKLLAAFEVWYRRYLQEGAGPIVEAFATAADLGPHHPPIRVTTSCSTWHGVPIGLGLDGDLLVRNEAGIIECVRSGDVGLIAAEKAMPPYPALGAASND